mgnify:CR=1 FL=1
MNINEKTRKALLRFQQNEITESLLYTQLAAIEKDPSNKEVLLQITNDEKGHYTILKKYTGQEISPNKLRVTKYYWLARILGITFAIKLMEDSEESAKNDYASYDEYPDLQQIARDEDEHEHHHHHHHHDDEDEDEHEHHHHHHDHDDDDECDDPECSCHHHHDDDDEDVHEHHHHHHHHHGHDADEVFVSWGMETHKKFTTEQIEGILKQLENAAEYGMVLRAKGYVASQDAERWIHFDYVPGESDIREGGAMITGRVCVIGSKLNESAIASLFGE